MITILVLLSCENTLTRSFGGEQTISLPPCQKLINATWKETDVWYLVRPMHEGEEPETYVFQEKSSLGALEGTVFLNETPCGAKP